MIFPFVNLLIPLCHHELDALALAQIQQEQW